MFVEVNVFVTMTVGVLLGTRVEVGEKVAEAVLVRVGVDVCGTGVTVGVKLDVRVGVIVDVPVRVGN